MSYGRPRAAKGKFPYLNHRTQAEIREDQARRDILASLGADKPICRRIA